jgi:hypothetical protein
MTNEAVAKPRQTRLTAVVSQKQKRQAERLAKMFSNGNVGELIRQLLMERHDLYLKQKKAGSADSATNGTNPTNLIRGQHVRLGKPGRKRSPSKPAANNTKSSSAKSTAKRRLVAVSSKESAGSSGPRTKKR